MLLNDEQLLRSAENVNKSTTVLGDRCHVLNGIKCLQFNLASFGVSRDTSSL